MEKEIDDLILLGQKLAEEKKFASFQDYRSQVATWVRNTFTRVDDAGIKQLLIKLLEMPLERSFLYRWVLIDELGIDLLFLRWSTEGKYKFYIIRSSTLLDAIRYRSSNQSNYGRSGEIIL